MKKNGLPKKDLGSIDMALTLELEKKFAFVKE